ncbi:hypothetical protein I7I48_04306 [Histoplasma ohiense]|nr:hypothetical protein I7I48_04306 [Histoplasma ohiense (nom. inval.)]
MLSCMVWQVGRNHGDQNASEVTVRDSRENQTERKQKERRFGSVSPRKRTSKSLDAWDIFFLCCICSSWLVETIS